MKDLNPMVDKPAERQRVEEEEDLRESGYEVRKVQVMKRFKSTELRASEGFKILK